MPLLTVPNTENNSKKTKSLKIALPKSRFSEFSIGNSGGLNDMNDDEILVEEKPVREKRLSLFLTSSCKVCTTTIELRR